MIACARLSLATALLLAATTAAFAAAALREPMLLRDEGMFFVNGQNITSNYPSVPANGAPVPGTLVVKQMFVHYRIPATLTHKYPIVMVHGGGLTGMSYETTPDGREGWSTYFVRKGFATYVVDIPGRGRSGFDPTQLNQAKYQSNPALLPSITRNIREGSWTAFRFGPALGTPYPGVQYPVEAYDAFVTQSVPYTEVTLPGGAGVNDPLALVALLDRIGPAILLVHSQSGPDADALVAMRPNLVKGVINIEGNHAFPPAPAPAQISAYRDVPDLELFGDRVQGNPANTGQARYDLRKKVSESINASGGRSMIVQLPEVGLHGNTHMMMQDKNNLEVADYIIGWIGQAVK